MLNTNGNLWLTIIKSIFIAINIGLISLGLVSCDLNQQSSPPQIERPTIDSDPSPNPADKDEEDEEDGEDEGDEEQDTEQQNKS